STGNCSTATFSTTTANCPTSTPSTTKCPAAAPGTRDSGSKISITTECGVSTSSTTRGAYSSTVHNTISDGRTSRRSFTTATKSWTESRTTTSCTTEPIRTI